MNSALRTTAKVAALALAFVSYVVHAGSDSPAMPAPAKLDLTLDRASLPEPGDPPKLSSGQALTAQERTPAKNYWLPGLEIVAFDVLLNRFDHAFMGDEYDVSASSIRRNLRSSWDTDRDPFAINQFLHPYQGAVYFGLARSAGLNYWESFAYTFAGSIFWEIAGETTPPAKNDQITSGIGGTFLGESLYRLSNLILERDTYLSPFWREAAAAAVAPSAAFNRYAFGERFNTIFASGNPAYYRSLHVGARSTRNVRGNLRKIDDRAAVVDFSIDYGLPGKPGYTYHRPFDYFMLQVAASTASGVESVTNRGLLIGRPYELGNSYRGVWGLYGGYDYLANELFRVSSTALSVGSTAQWWLSNNVALQVTGTVGIGYNATGTVRDGNERDYRYGTAPQGLASLRLIMGNQAALDLSARKYFVGNTTLPNGSGRDHVVQADAAFTFRVHRQHGITLRYALSRRDRSSPQIQDLNQRQSTVGVFYTNIGSDGFGAVDWR